MAEKIINKLTIDELSMPTKIYIGDSENTGIDLNENTFQKNFKCKSKWIGEATLKQIEIKTNENIQNVNYLTIIYAPTSKFLCTYKNNSIFDQQKFKNTEVLTSTKDATIQINDKSLHLALDNEGIFGDVLEVFNKTGKLEGLIINLYLGESNFKSLENSITEIL